MAKAYSQDLRDRVIEAVRRDGMTRRAAAQRFGISESSAIKWLQSYEREGRRHPRGTGGHRPSKTKPERVWLLAAIAAQPDITLEALSAMFLAERGVRADTGMLSRFFQSENISFKKKRFAIGAGPTGRGAPPGKLDAPSGTA
jgi:transposase